MIIVGKLEQAEPYVADIKSAESKSLSVTDVESASEPVRAKPVRKVGSRAMLNLCLDVALLGAALALVWVSVMMHVVFPVPTQTDDWVLWGWTFNQWRGVQSGALFVTALLAVEHLVLHWKWVCGMVATKILKAKRPPGEAEQAVYGVGTFVVTLLFMLVTIIAALASVHKPPM